MSMIEQHSDGKWYLKPLKVENVREAGLLEDDPCLIGDHCQHKECQTHHDMCCWCGEAMETWT